MLTFPPHGSAVHMEGHMVQSCGGIRTNLVQARKGKNAFYVALRGCIRTLADTDSPMILGDFNARVGIQDEAWNRELGPYGIEQRNENGIGC